MFVSQVQNMGSLTASVAINILEQLAVEGEWSPGGRDWLVVQVVLVLYSQPKGVKQKYIRCISGLVVYGQYIYTTAVVR